MTYLKSILAGVLAVLAAGLIIIGIFALLVGMMGGDWRSGISLSWKTGLTAVLIFGLGFAWQFRRTAKPALGSQADKKVTGSTSARR